MFAEAGLTKLSKDDAPPPTQSGKGRGMMYTEAGLTQRSKDHASSLSHPIWEEREGMT